MYVMSKHMFMYVGIDQDVDVNTWRHCCTDIQNKCR